MPELEKRAIVLVDSEQRESPAELHICHYNKQDRVLRAARSLLIFWSLAGVSLFIPLAHFVLVPLFLVLGPVFAVKQLRTDSVCESTHGVCPICNQSVEFVMDSDDLLPKSTYCPKCNGPVSLLEK